MTNDNNDLWELFHQMWGDAKVQRTYVKANWMALQGILKQRLEDGREKLPTKATLDQPLPHPKAKRYRTLFIEPKRDFGTQGFLINGKMVMKGWVVTDGLCNVMPGATWFQTVKKAKFAIDVLIAVRGHAGMFWEIMQRFEHTPGDRKEDFPGHPTNGNTTCGRHYAKYKDGVCIEVGILEKEIVGGFLA